MTVVCELCNRDFVDEDELRAHEERVHQEGLAAFGGETSG